MRMDGCAPALRESNGFFVFIDCAICYNHSMKRLKLYLETSVWNFYFADDAPEKRAETLRLFKKYEN